MNYKDRYKWIKEQAEELSTTLLFGHEDDEDHFAFEADTSSSYLLLMAYTRLQEAVYLMRMAELQGRLKKDS